MKDTESGIFSTPLAAFHKIFRSADIAILFEMFLLLASFYLLIQA